MSDPATGPVTWVVGAAVLRTRGGVEQVLLAQRGHPPQVAGRWEFPGGKVEPGETHEQAVRRELAEELAVEVEVEGWLPSDVEVRPGLVLRVAYAGLVGGRPVAREHVAVRWVPLSGLDEVDLLDADVPFVALLRDRQAIGSSGRGCAVFPDRDAAEAAASAWREAGFATEVSRAPFAGEDDDEDHAYEVLTDAPSAVLSRVCEEHDGWVVEVPDARHVDGPAAPPGGPGSRTPVSPLELPTGPRRLHRRAP